MFTNSHDPNLALLEASRFRILGQAKGIISAQRIREVLLKLF